MWNNLDLLYSGALYINQSTLNVVYFEMQKSIMTLAGLVKGINEILFLYQLYKKLSLWLDKIHRNTLTTSKSPRNDDAHDSIGVIYSPKVTNALIPFLKRKE